MFKLSFPSAARGYLEPSLFNLEVNPGEVHGIVSTGDYEIKIIKYLLQFLSGNENKSVNYSCTADFEGNDLLGLTFEERANHGIYIATSDERGKLPKVTTFHSLRPPFDFRSKDFSCNTVLNKIRKYNGKEPLDEASYMQLLSQKVKLLRLANVELCRIHNYRNLTELQSQILMMAILEPKLAIWNIADLGLNDSEVSTLYRYLSQLRTPENAMIIFTNNISYRGIYSDTELDFWHLFQHTILTNMGNIS